MLRVLSNHQMKQLLRIDEVIGVIETGFRSLADAPCRAPVRLALELPEREDVVLYMPAYLTRDHVLGAKVVSVFPENGLRNMPVVSGTYLLHDAETGALKALMDATYMTGIRTAATSAVATKYLARDSPDTLGIIGAGVQAEFHVEALLLVRTFRRVLVYTRSQERGLAFVERMALRCDVPVELASSAEEVARQSDVIATCTRSQDPVLEGRFLRPGVHINAVGAFTPEMRELDELTVVNARIVVDTYEGALAEAGDILIPMRTGAIDQEHLHADLTQILTGQREGRTDDRSITVFESVGFAMEDAVTASLAYDLAVENDVGTMVDL
jgi:ornithine cyclodeaminase/alanine dehydrogenase-like protein (mu-crystallin family)